MSASLDQFSEIDKVEIKMREWKQESNEAHANYQMTKQPRFLTDGLELDAKLSKAKKWLADRRAIKS